MSGTEMVLKPDKQIFGNMDFSVEIIRSWVEENVANGVKVIIEEENWYFSRAFQNENRKFSEIHTDIV